MFDAIAPEYDRLNHILSLHIDKIWRKKAVKSMTAGIQAPNILDVASGTGDFAIAIARSAGPGSKITGIDISEGMLAVGREKVERLGLSGTIVLEQGDCENIPYAEGSFDRVSVAFGIRNFENMDKGLSEMFRVLRRGGTLTVLELSEPGNRFVRWLYRVYFLNILPRIGGFVSGNRGAYEYLPASVRNFPKPDAFMEKMESAGFSGIRHESLTFGICRMYTGQKR